MDMQRIIGFLLIFAGCAGLGAWYEKRYREQVHILRRFVYILELLEGEIRYGRCALAECCWRIANCVEEPYQTSFRQIYEKMCENEGDSFKEICRESLWNGLKDIAVKKEDKELFISCFAENGYYEDVLQLRMIEQRRKQLEERLAETEKENTAKGKLAMGMGVMSGLLLIILLL